MLGSPLVWKSRPLRASSCSLRIRKHRQSRSQLHFTPLHPIGKEFLGIKCGTRACTVVGLGYRRA
jgi:hypothetical protein